MSQNIRIALTNAPDRIPDFYKDSDGLVSFDLRDGTDVAITKQVDEATEIGKIRQDTVKNFNIPATKKNRAIVGQVGSPQAFNVLHNIPYEVQIFVGDYLLPERFARIVGVSDRGGFEVEVAGDQFGWIKPISDQKLRDIDLGTFDFTQVNVESAQEFDFEYADGGTIVNFPLVNYGAWPLIDRVQLEDFRPWFNILGLLQEGFCAIGWKFRCPILETSYGRRLWAYLLKENFRESSVSLVDRQFQAEMTTPLNILNAIGCITFDDDFTPPNGDPGGHYDNTTEVYQSQVVADFFFEGEVTVINAGTPFCILAILKVDQFGNAVRLGEQLFEFPVDGTFPVAISAANVNVFATDQVCLHITSLGLSTDTFQLESGARFWNKVNSATYERGDTLILNQLFSEDYLTIDLLKGIVHLLNLKPHTAVDTKTIFFYPENGAIDFYAEGNQEAYFFPNTKAKDWTEKIQCKSLVEELEGKDLTNEYLFEFKPTSDSGIELLKLDLPLHSELITQTQGDFKEGRTSNENPFFEPTRNDLDSQIAFPISTQPIPYIPFIWDSEPEEGDFLPTKSSVKIAPRICLAYGYDFIGLSAEATGQVNPAFGQYTWEDGTIQNEYLLFGQVLKEGVVVINSPGIEDEMVTYGSEIRTDLKGMYDYLYVETIRTLYFGFPVEFLILLTLNDLINFSNRDRIFFRYFSEIYGELSLFARVVKIEDFLINRNLSTPVQLLPKTNFLQICE